MKIDHLALYVRDLEGAKDFFCRFFAACPSALYHNQKTTFRSYFLSFADGCRLEIMTRDDLTDAPRADKALGYAHLCFALGSRQAVDAKAQELSQAGFTLLSGPRVTGDGYYEAQLQGFEGNLIEISV